MSLTVAATETDLLVMMAPYLTRVGLDGTTSDGTNESLRIPIRRAARRMGLPLADGMTVTDDDLTALAEADHETFEDLALLKALEICRGNWAEFDQSKGELSQSLSQFTKALDDWIAALKTSLGPLAEDPDSALVPGPMATGLIKEGRGCGPTDAYGRRQVGAWYAAGGWYP